MGVIRDTLEEGIHDEVAEQVINSYTARLTTISNNLTFATQQYQASQTLNNTVKNLEKNFFSINDADTGWSSVDKNSIESILEFLKGNTYDKANELLNDKRQIANLRSAITRAKNRLQTLQISNTANKIKDNLNTENVKQAILDGYQILNEIGEDIRNSTIFYEVNLIADGSEGITSGYLTLQEIMNNPELLYLDSYGRIKFDTEKTINTIFSDNSGFKLQVWTQERINNFNHMLNFVQWFEQLANSEDKFWKNINKDGFQYLNKGNIMEAFRWAEEEIIRSNGAKEFDETLMEEAMRITLGNNLPFYQGPDIKSSKFADIFDKTSIDLQLKNVNASLTNIFTISKQVNNALQYFRSFISNNKADLPAVEDISDDNVAQRAAEKLLSMFGA